MEIDENRTEFGFARTKCDCEECTHNCKHMPGYLIPDDVERIMNAPNAVIRSNLDRLAASPGALVSKNGVPFRIPTIVPARKEDGSCIFLTKDNKCSIH